MNLSEAKKILNLGHLYTPIELKTNYRNLIKKFHPDKNPDGTCKFIKIQEAYEFINKTPPSGDFIENILKSFNFKFNKVNTSSIPIVISPSEYLTGVTKEIKELNNCKCPQPLCKNCFGTGLGCIECIGNGFIKSCSCDKYIIKKVVVPKRCNLNANNFVLSDNYKIINDKLTCPFDITLKESLLGFTKTFEDPFREIHTISIKNTIVKQNDGYTITCSNHEMILLFNIIYPERLTKHTKKILLSLDF